MEQLCDPVYFREFFSANHSANWYKCLGNWTLDTNTEILFHVDELKVVVEDMLAKDFDFDQEALKTVFLEGTDVSVESFIRSRPSASERYLILAALECLRLHVPMNEAEILG